MSTASRPPSRARGARRPLLRWLVPAGVAVVLAGGGSAVGLIQANAGERLAPRTAAQLLVDVQKAQVKGLSGTIVQDAELGLPSLPGLGGGSGSSDLSSLVSGSHTLRVWSDGTQRSRVSLMGSLGESDVVRDGRTVWVWSSKAKTATRYTLPAHQSSDRSPADTTVTPQQAAESALKALTPSTRVAPDGTATVAGRRAYELVLEPRQAGSLVGSVRIAVDGATRVPLRVQVFARGASDPAFEVGFTSFDPTAPAASVFAFNPPPGTKVTTKDPGAPGSSEKAQKPSTREGSKAGAKAEEPVVSGTGWATVVVAKVPAQAVAGMLSGASRGATGDSGTSGQADEKSGSAGGLAGVLSALPRASGDWGSGRVLQGTLFSAVLSDDGRVAVGAVSPETLYAALARR
ncbi:MAG: Outer rane lipoproteinsorting protein [Marmoricola sp.]|nr:Outer rane lipoproteinsorting protein [Marmoricola sp.]